MMAPVGGYLLGWLTGVIAQDHANASSTLLYDVRLRTWSEEMLAASGIDLAPLAEIRPSHEIVGPCSRVRPAPRAHYSLQGRGGIGRRARRLAGRRRGVSPGTITDVTGTAEPVTAVAAEIVFDPERLVETHAHAVDGAWLIENPGFVSGGSTLWLSGTCSDAPQAELFDDAAKVPAGSEGVLFLPTLCGATAPRWNDRVRGVFAGLSLNHERGHLARAVLEGCAFALRDIVVRLDAMGLAVPRSASSAAALVAPWMQIKADVTGGLVRAVLRRNQQRSARRSWQAWVRSFADAARRWHGRRACLRADRARPEAVEVYDEALSEVPALFDAVEVALP